jgi:Ca2+-binding RTX toxin-like protein
MTILRGTGGNNTLVDRTSDKQSEIHGLDGNDKLYGGKLTDYLFGGAGTDALYGGADRDWLTGGRGGDRLDGGSGYDGASYYASNGVHVSLDRSIVGTGDAAGDTFVFIEMLEGSNTGADVLAGNSGENWMWGHGGDDKVNGRAGDDTLDGGAGKDALNGEAGDDWLRGGAGSDVLNGGAGIDAADYSRSVRVNIALDFSFSATGDAVGDRFVSIEKVIGSDYANTHDKISGNSATNYLLGLQGDDYLYGRGGNDWLIGGSGADRLDGGTGRDGVYYGESQGVYVSLDRSLRNTEEALGDTFISIENIEGSLTGGDYLIGNSSANSIFGNGGSDSLFGRSGNDFISGGDTSDELQGESGNDLLVGGEGYDTLFGGSGNDTFAFDRPSHGVDRIFDFATGEKLVFDKAAFGNPKLGTLEAFRFQTGQDHNATTTAIRFIYDVLTQSLWFDGDGSGSKAAVEIANLGLYQSLTNTEIEISIL